MFLLCKQRQKVHYQLFLYLSINFQAHIYHKQSELFFQGERVKMAQRTQNKQSLIPTIIISSVLGILLGVIDIYFQLDLFASKEEKIKRRQQRQERKREFERDMIIYLTSREYIKNEFDVLIRKLHLIKDIQLTYSYFLLGYSLKGQIQYLLKIQIPKNPTEHQIALLRIDFQSVAKALKKFFSEPFINKLQVKKDVSIELLIKQIKQKKQARLIYRKHLFPQKGKENPQKYEQL